MSGHFHRHIIGGDKAGEWKVRFPAKGTNLEITMHIPTSGIFDDPDDTRQLQRAHVERLADAISGILDDVLAQPDQVPKQGA